MSLSAEDLAAIEAIVRRVLAEKRPRKRETPPPAKADQSKVDLVRRRLRRQGVAA